MAEQFHRRGHHVQKAHGRRAQLASDGSHLSGAMIALMPTPEDARRIALKGGEAPEDLHVTLFYLGQGDDFDEPARSVITDHVREVLTWASPEGPVKAKIFGVAHWNGGDEGSWVWSVGDLPDEEGYGTDLRDFQMIALEALALSEVSGLPAQHSPWVPHICAAYTNDLTLVRELEKRLGEITFDRIRITFGQDVVDIPLAGALTAAGGLRRDLRPHEEDVDFQAIQRAWQTGTDAVTLSLAGVFAKWTDSLAAQVADVVDTGDMSRMRTISLDTGDAAALLHAQMVRAAEESARQVEKEMEAQGLQPPRWTLAGRRTRLMQRTAAAMSDLMAGSLVVAAKRHVLASAGTETPGSQVARDLREYLAGMRDTGPREAVGAALTAAQNAGRRAVLEAAPLARYYASEILDARTCAPCRKLDGQKFPTLDAAYKAYPTGGYRRCQGMLRCRGMVVARWADEVPALTAASPYDDTNWRSSMAESGIQDRLSRNEGDLADGTPGGEKDRLPLGGERGKDKRLRANKGRKGYGMDEMPGDCPPGMEPGPDGECVEIPEGEGPPGKQKKAAPPVQAASEGAPDLEGHETAPWRGPLTVEGIETGDGRQFDPGSLTWADLPLPLRWNKEDSHGGEPHTVAVNVGRIDKIWREDSGLILGEGLLDLSDEDGQKVHSKIKGQYLRGVSVDVDSVKDADMELVWPEQPDGGDAGDDPFAQLFAAPEKVVFHKGRIRAATLVDIPAFAEAYIALLDEAGAVVAGGERIGALRAVHGYRDRTTGVEPPARPPADWFASPDLSVPTGITVTREGRVYGHAALWGTCHIGQAGVCVTPPEESDHPYFMTGHVWTAEGRSVPVGQVTVGTGHAPIDYGHRAASDHYDNTGAAVADVAVGNDAHGIWIAGAVRPGTSAERVHELRASGQVSGDWRSIGGQLRLVGLLAVNVPGFPVPKLRTHLSGGSQLALVAAGMPSLTEQLTEDELDQFAYRRIMTRLAERVHRKE